MAKFVKGQTGNPGGRPKADKTIEALCRAHTAMAIQALIDIASNQNAAPAPRVAAATAILDRGWGKPAASLTVDATVRRPAVELTDDDLAAVAASSGIGADTTEDDPPESDDVV